MKFPTRTLRYAWTTAWVLFTSAAVLSALVFIAARLLLPYADRYSPEISTRVGELLGQPIIIQSLNAEWHGLGPSLVLEAVDVLDADTSEPVLAADKVRLRFNVMSSLLHWRPVFSRITLVGVELMLTRDASGRIAVAGLMPGQEVAGDVGAFAGWLFSQGWVSLEDSNILWRDLTGNGRSLQFTRINVTLRNQAQSHRLEASLQLPSHAGRALRFTAEMEGDPLAPEGNHTRAYLRGEKVDLAELFGPQWLGAVGAAVGKSDFSLWTEWRGYRLHTMAGEVDAHDVRFAADVPPEEGPPAPAARETMAIQRLAGHFRWNREAGGWHFDGDDILLLRDGKPWRPARLALDFGQDEALPRLRADMSFLRVEDIARVLELFKVGGASLQDALRALAPAGEVYDAHLDWRGGEAMRYRAYAEFADFAVNAWRAVPAAEAMSGQLWLDEGGGQVALKNARGELDYPALFRAPLQAKSLSGQVAWRLNAGGWQVAGRDLVAGNDDIRGRAALDVAGGGAQPSPFLSLVVKFQDGDAGQVARYLPVGVMSASSVEWLDEAIVGARIVSGGALFHGRLARFPFDAGDGRFEVGFHIDHGELNYAPGWPRIEDIAGDVLFQGRGLEVAATGGRIFHSALEGVTVAIPDMTAKPMLLSIRGDVRGPTQDKLDYLVASPPLNRRIGQHLAMLNAGGDSLLHLDLLLPLGADAETEVRGSVELTDNTLGVPPLGTVLSQLNGTLRFTQDGLEAEAIQTALLGQASSVGIRTRQTAGHRQIDVEAQGAFDAQDLAARYLPVVADLLDGGSPWNVALHIPIGEQYEPTAATVLRVTSSLEGVNARLPPPFNKTAAERLPIQLRLNFPPGQLPLLLVDYGDFLTAVCEISGKSPTGVKRGELRLGGGAVKLPDEDGMRVVGWLDRFSLDVWRSLLGNLGGNARGDAPWVHSADVALREAQAFGQTLHNLQLQANAEAGRWTLKLASEELGGEIALPKGDAPLEARLRQVHLSKPETGGGTLDPRTFPALHVTAEDVRFEDRHLGSVKLEITKMADGLRIEQLIIKPRSTTITAQGGWTVSGDTQRSHIKMHVESSRIDRTLKSLGYTGVVEGGTGELDLDLEWPGSFADAGAEHLNGQMNLHLRDGRLLDVDPGAGGRVFGMLSFQTLPRRLFLDFSDVFQKGFGFDEIKGRFNIENGDAYTNNLIMDGPAARVEIGGRVGLVQQDYDQLVTVTPHLGESLPVIGALAAAPAVGAALLFAQKLFKPQIDSVTRNQYTVTGSWNAPVIKKAGSPKKPKNGAGNVE